jgi:predicted restriction endonuclease
MEKLMTRDEFRNAVFERDNHRCVICNEQAVDAHHIMERRLWPDGGYYLNNGASLCEEHHIEAEKTNISTEEIRKSAGIEVILLPPHLYDDAEYDTWGNEILKNGGHRQRFCRHPRSGPGIGR